MLSPMVVTEIVKSGVPGAFKCVERYWGVKIAVAIEVGELNDGSFGPRVRVFLPEDVHRRELNFPPECVADLAWFRDECLDVICLAGVLTWLHGLTEHLEKPAP